MKVTISAGPVMFDNVVASTPAPPARVIPTLGDLGPMRGATGCTGLSAAWCPVHGRCTCPRRDVAMDAPDCPLHSEGSDHAEEPEPDPYARLARAIAAAPTGKLGAITTAEGIREFVERYAPPEGE